METVTYPEFKRLTFKDKSIIEQLSEGLEPNSDTSFFTLFSWSNSILKTYYSVLNGNLIFKIPDVFGENLVITLVGNNKIEDSVDRILRDYPSLSEIPQNVLEKLPKNRFISKEEPENFEYVYDLKKSSEMEGAEYSSIRHKLSKFIKEYGDHIQVKEIYPNILWYKNNYKDLHKKWINSSDNKNKKVSHFEKSALYKFIKYRSKFNSVCYGFFYKGELIGFCSNVIMNNTTVIGNHSKADKRFRGLYNYIFYKNSELLYKKGFKYINLEQDIGDEGIREFKNWLKPSFLIKKYNISLA